MNRAEIKEEAKEKIRGKLWEVWKPLLVVVVVGAIFGILVPGTNDPYEMNSGRSLISVIFDFLLAPLSIGVYGYVLNFIRGKKYDVKDIFNYYKNIWPIILITFLTSLFVVLWSILFIIPGIIAALSYSMVIYLMADGDVDGINTMRKSQEMMQGYKWDYFIFGLSFFWWIVLVGITFGIAAIYVVPYMSVSQALYYEKLRKLKKIKA